LTSATLLPPVAVNPREVNAVVAGADGTDGATEAKGHLPEAQSPASASCAEIVASKRRETIRRRGIVFIVEICCVTYYLLSGQPRKGLRLTRLSQVYPDAGRDKRASLRISTNVAVRRSASAQWVALG
jgi:hypothetical protein